MDIDGTAIDFNRIAPNAVEKVRARKLGRNCNRACVGQRRKRKPLNTERDSTTCTACRDVDSALQQMCIQKRRGVASDAAPTTAWPGLFCFPDVTFVLVQLPGGSHRRRAIFLHSAKASGHARDIFHASATPIVLARRNAL